MPGQPADDRSVAQPFSQMSLDDGQVQDIGSVPAFVHRYS